VELLTRTIPCLFPAAQSCCHPTQRNYGLIDSPGHTPKIRSLSSALPRDHSFLTSQQFVPDPSRGEYFSRFLKRATECWQRGRQSAYCSLLEASCSLPAADCSQTDADRLMAVDTCSEVAT